MEMTNSISLCDPLHPQGQVFAEDKDHSFSHPVCGCVSQPLLSCSDHDHDLHAYRCSFCPREFRSAQALGGHMNVHRRDRALLRLQAQQNHTLYGCHPAPALASSSCIVRPTSDTKGSLPKTSINSCSLPSTQNGSEPSSRTVASSSSSNTCGSYCSSATAPLSPAHRDVDFLQTSTFPRKANPSGSNSPISNKDAPTQAAIYVDLELRLGVMEAIKEKEQFKEAHDWLERWSISNQDLPETKGAIRDFIQKKVMDTLRNGCNGKMNFYKKEINPTFTHNEQQYLNDNIFMHKHKDANSVSTNMTWR